LHSLPAAVRLADIARQHEDPAVAQADQVLDHLARRHAVVDRHGGSAADPPLQQHLACLMLLRGLVAGGGDRDRVAAFPRGHLDAVQALRKHRMRQGRQHDAKGARAGGAQSSAGQIGPELELADRLPHGRRLIRRNPLRRVQDARHRGYGNPCMTRHVDHGDGAFVAARRIAGHVSGIKSLGGKHSRKGAR